MIESPQMKISAVGVAAATVSCYALLLLAPTKVIASLVVFGYFGLMYAFFSDAVAALVTGYVGLLPVTIGKFFPVDLVSAKELNYLLGRPYGIASDFTVGIPEAVTLVLAVILIVRRLRRKEPMDPFSWMLFLLPVTEIAVSALGSLRPDVSVLRALYDAEPFVLYAAITRMGKRVSYDGLIAAGSAAVICASLILFAEAAGGRLLGVILEPYPGYLPVDLSTDAGGLVRMGGTFGYANSFAQYLLFAVGVLLPYIGDFRPSMRRLTAGAVAAGFLSLVVTQSRSAWLAFAMGLGWYAWSVRRNGIRWYPDVVRIGAVTTVLAVVLAGTVVWPRLAGTSRTLEPYGSMETRLKLLPEAWQVIASRPLLGVGLGMDSFALYEKARAEHRLPVSYFPEPVHNGFLEKLMETGIVGFGIYVVLIIMIILRIRKLYADRPKRVLAAGLIVGFAAQSLNAFTQPLVPALAAAVVFTGVLERVKDPSLPGPKIRRAGHRDTTRV